MSAAETTAKYRAYTEAFRDGMRDACDGVSTAHAWALGDEANSSKERDAYLAGYYAEKRRLRNYEDLER